MDQVSVTRFFEAKLFFLSPARIVLVSNCALIGLCNSQACDPAACDRWNEQWNRGQHHFPHGNFYKKNFNVYWSRWKKILSARACQQWTGSATLNVTCTVAWVLYLESAWFCLLKIIVVTEILWKIWRSLTENILWLFCGLLWEHVLRVRKIWSVSWLAGTAGHWGGGGGAAPPACQIHKDHQV